MPSKHPKPRVVDITIRITRKDGKPATRTDARKALWAAHKILQRGGSLRELKAWDIHAIDWRNTYASGHSKTYTYDTDMDEVLGNMGGILESVGMDALRVEPHTPGE